MSKPGAAAFSQEETAWAANPAVFAEFLARTDVFGHRMCGDARVANRERLREERIEFFLANYPCCLTEQRAMFNEAKSNYFKEMS